jgi:hypothetical protein
LRHPAQKAQNGLLPRSYVRDLDANELATLTPRLPAEAISGPVIDELKSLDDILADAFAQIKQADEVGLSFSQK